MLRVFLILHALFVDEAIEAADVFKPVAADRASFFSGPTLHWMGFLQA